jgi:hypothetical protein
MIERTAGLICFLICAACTCLAQHKTYMPARGSAERIAQMKLLHREFDPKFYKQQIVFTVDSETYKSDGSWAFANLMVYQKGGAPVDFNRSAYKEAWKNEIMDSNGINALFKKEKSGWTLMAYFDFPTDVPYGCWWREYKVPKNIFPYTEPAETCDAILKETNQP